MRTNTEIRMDVQGASLDEIEATTRQRLEDFAPGREWAVGTDVTEDTVFSGDGSVVVVRYNAEVRAILVTRPTR